MPSTATTPAIPDVHWISLNEAADYLAVSTKTIRRYITQGKLEACRVGPKIIRVNEASLVRCQAMIGNLA